MVGGGGDFRDVCAFEFVVLELSAQHHDLIIVNEFGVALFFWQGDDSVGGLYFVLVDFSEKFSYKANYYIGIWFDFFQS